MLFGDEVTFQKTGDKHHTTDDPFLLITLSLYSDILQFRTDGKRIFDVSFQDVAKGFLHPGVLIFIGRATRATGDI